ncbi:CYTH domain-containing protein [Virgibacillus sp. MSJ-26]|uniref:CYTH domain-containing protein n=1 Tax=Virgibacillus sp. MSJ-26 TaxID=2841522 RepID=UPI001C1056C1|nr:CYTH domain-containing protein [Virgibacillus sp. MSJ-26]MBU5468512.1 CYTH domain-containing protein [Virgibacillus sp. MSJ-26]
MSQEIEIEFKNLLTKEEFNQIRTYLSFPDKGIVQTNYYFETKDFSLKNNHAALRIREKSGEYTLTLKQPEGQGLLETHDCLTRVETDEWLSGHPVSKPHTAKQLADMDIDPSNLIYYGSLTTTRLEYNHKGFIYVLDDSHYNNHSDYELEIEAPSYDVGLTTFNQLLTTLSIPRRKTPNKIERFFSSLS